MINHHTVRKATTAVWAPCWQTYVVRVYFNMSELAGVHTQIRMVYLSLGPLGCLPVSALQAASSGIERVISKKNRAGETENEGLASFPDLM